MASEGGESSGPGITDFVQADTARLVDYFQNAYESMTETLSKPNILMVGCTGAGKTSIVKAVFGSLEVDEHFDEDEAIPFRRYASEDVPIVLYDSKGLEIGRHEKFMGDCRKFFEEMIRADISQVSLSHEIHIMWYVVDVSQGRFQPFEETLCRELFKDIPAILFLLNKADGASKADLDSLKQVIQKMNLPNCKGIFETVARSEKYAEPQLCANCGSADIGVSLLKKVATCVDCNHEFPLQEEKFGWDEVVNATLDNLPKLAKDAFVAAQQISFRMKDRTAYRIILKFEQKAQKLTSTHALEILISQTLTRLSLLWRFRQHAQLYGKQLSGGIANTFDIRDRIFMLIHSNKTQLYRSLALIIVWNRSVRSLNKKFFELSVDSALTKQDVKKWFPIMVEIFSKVNEEVCDLVSDAIDKKGLRSVLNDEMPDVGKEVPDEVDLGSSSSNLSSPSTSGVSGAMLTRKPSYINASRANMHEAAVADINEADVVNRMKEDIEVSEDHTFSHEDAIQWMQSALNLESEIDAEVLFKKILNQHLIAPVVRDHGDEHESEKLPAEPTNLYRFVEVFIKLADHHNDGIGKALDVRNFTDVLTAMKRTEQDGGLALRKHKRLFKSYHHSFTGAELVNWLLRYAVRTREEAADFGQTLLRDQYIVPAKHQKEDESHRSTFKDSKHTLYVFSGKEIEVPETVDSNSGFKDYEIISLLGEGATSKVMKVREKSSGKLFAMKIMYKERLLQSEKKLTNIITERKVLVNNHPFLVALHSCFQTRRKIYLVMDYIAGGTLSQHLAMEGFFSEKVAQFFTAELCLALEYLHGNGIIYRDLKPENVMIDLTGNVCLTDFGICKQLLPNEKTNSFCGTPSHLAPEVILRNGYSFEVDMWSLGILLYELLVGRTPFSSSKSRKQLFEDIQSKPIEYPETLSSEALSLLNGLLNRNPEERFKPADLKKHPFYSGLNWEKLEQRQLKSPYKPSHEYEASEDGDDVVEITPDFTSEQG